MHAQPLDPRSVPLQGTNLIEASAGTGKTWNIAMLFVRLVLLERLPVDQILVVTFTKAATAELKGRLRARLDEALSLLDAPSADDKDPLAQLVAQARQNESEERLQLRLKAALSDFDNAAIYTIHGFCQRVLQDFAFYCGAPFELELDESGDGGAQTAAEDFWRRRVAADGETAALAYAAGLTPQSVCDALKPYLGRPYLAIRQPESSTAAREDYARRWQEVAAQLPALDETFFRLHPALNGNVYRQATYRSKFDRLLGWAAADSPPAPSLLAKALANSSGGNPFSAEALEKGLKKGATAPDGAIDALAPLAALLDAATAAAAETTAALVALQLDLLREVRQAREAAKADDPKRGFDDLLLDVARALQPENRYAGELAQAMAAKWRVALIDEFQDTDPLQYGIFERAFAQTGTPLFLVGDPKQAIYSFRGADIFAYLQAADDAGARYTLGTNRRSHRRLIESIGRLFAREEPFRLPKIDYQPVDAARDENRLEPADAPVRLRWLNEGEGGENADTLDERAAEWCAAEIAARLQQAQQGSLKIGGRPLEAGQIAVLVRARRHGEMVQRTLKRAGVQSVLASRADIFDGEEAEALYALLGFFLQSGQSSRLHFVLSGCLFDYGESDIRRLQEDEQALLQWIQSAGTTLDEWQRHGAYAALRGFFNRHGVETRLLAQGNERTLTNLHQLLELLAAEDEASHTPASLHQWLGRRIAAARAGQGGDSEAVLRLESDENLVKIVTFHASKGLQYPLVYCPFVWRAGGSGERQDWHIVHDNRHQNRAELLHHSQLSEDDQQQIEAEALSEDLRLLYVALTRAEEDLTLYLAACRDGGRSALAYLLGCDAATAKDSAAYRARWQEFARQNDGFTLTGAPPAFSGSLKAAAAPNGRYRALDIAPRRFRFVRHTSFTALSRSRDAAAGEDELLPALDGAERRLPAAGQPENGAEASGIHAFPAGPAAGICLHAVLEKYRFDHPAAAQAERVAETLNRHGFDSESWLAPVLAMIEQTAALPLGNGLTLAAIPPPAMRTEMDFLLHSDSFRLRDIRDFLAVAGLPPLIQQAARRLDFYDVEGYISGFIDLAALSGSRALLVDYKSNLLGSDADAYGQEALEAAVAEHHYYLQALIYAVAAARYLRGRGSLPENIAVRYLFLRGLDNPDTHGIWQWDIATADLAPWL